MRGQTKGAVPLSFPFGHMEALPRMDKAEQAALRQRMRDRYAVHYSKLGEAEAASEPADQNDVPSETETDHPPSQSEDNPPPGHVDTTPGEDW